MPSNLAPRRPVSRRRFLQMGCVTVAAAGLTLGGIALVTPDPPPIERPSFVYGEGNADRRILVAYASATGSTVEIAAEIGKTLGSRGFSVDVKPILEKPQVDGYQAVLIGSVVHYGNWLPEAVEFVETNQQALDLVPVALFTVHIVNLGNDEQSVKNRLAYLDQVRPLLKPVAEVFFAGRFDRRGATLLFPGLLSRLVLPMDFRDWKKIHGWAQTVLA